MVWFLANYYYMVWSECEGKGSKLKVGAVRGFLLTKLKGARCRNVELLAVNI